MQNDLHELYHPLEFDLIDRSVHMVNNILCAMMLCGSIPILIPIVLFDIVLQYVIDRLWFHRVYVIPEYFSGRFAKAMMTSLFYAIPLHCLLTLWAFCKSYLQSDTHTLFDMFVEVSPAGAERRQLRGGGGGGGRDATTSAGSDINLIEAALTRRATLVPLVLLLLTVAKPIMNIAVPGAFGLGASTPRDATSTCHGCMSWCAEF